MKFSIAIAMALSVAFISTSQAQSVAAKKAHCVNEARSKLTFDIQFNERSNSISISSPRGTEENILSALTGKSFQLPFVGTRLGFSKFKKEILYSRAMIEYQTLSVTISTVELGKLGLVPSRLTLEVGEPTWENDTGATKYQYGMICTPIVKLAIVRPGA